MARDLRGEGLRHRRRSSCAAARERRADSRRSIRRRTISRAICFPNTYSLPRRATAEQLVAAHGRPRFAKALTPELVAARRGARPDRSASSSRWRRSSRRKPAKPEERPLVAAVYTNRLRIGMGMQCDPTVIYALERAGRYTGNLTRDDLQFDSPYNTYRYAGLPPGPIAAPGRASLEAAAQPGRRAVPLLRQPQRRLARVRRRRSTSTIATSSSIRSKPFRAFDTTAGSMSHAAARVRRCSRVRSCCVGRVRCESRDAGVR